MSTRETPGSPEIARVPGRGDPAPPAAVSEPELLRSRSFRSVGAPRSQRSVRREKRGLVAGSGSVLEASGRQWHEEAEVGVRSSSDDNMRGGRGSQMRGDKTSGGRGPGTQARWQETARGEWALSHQRRPGFLPQAGCLQEAQR